jgi:tetratricopeptide (TPR) repeat protein
MSTWLLWSLLSLVTGNPLLAGLLVLALWFLGDLATFRVLPDFGRWFARQGQASRLRADLERNPHDRRARLALAEILLERGRPAEAAPLLRANLEAGDRDVFTLAALGAALARSGAAAEAEARLAEARALEPGFRMGALELELGRLRLAVGDAAGACEPLRRLVQDRPGTVEGRYLLAQALTRLGDAAGAARARDEAWSEYVQQPRFRRREDRRWAWRLRPWRPALVALAVLLAALLALSALSGAGGGSADRRDRASELQEP